MSLNRQLQLRLLNEMSAEYPRWVGYYPAPDDEEPMAANLMYLAEHGLCESGVQVGVDGHLHFGNARITAAGLDFLAGDGGLSAILGVVTIKVHADTLRDLIATKIEMAPIPEVEKTGLKRHLAALSETALRATTTDLVKIGLDHLPDAIHWLRTLVGP